MPPLGVRGLLRPTYSRVCRGNGTGGASPSGAGRAGRRRRARPCAGPLPRDGDRPGAPRRPDHRRRLDVDGHDAVQPEPARSRRSGERGRHRRRRRPARLQHDRRLGQPVSGDTRNARLADLARGDRRLDRADGARARLRRPRLPGRLRQDRPGRVDGTGAGRQAGRRALRRADARGPLARTRCHDPGRLGGGRRRGAGADAAGRPRRARTARVSRRRHLRRPLHRQHDGGRTRLPRDRAHRRRADPRRRAREEG